MIAIKSNRVLELSVKLELQGFTDRTRYTVLDPLPWARLVAPMARAEDALARLDERIAKSPVRDGFAARIHFEDACASLWLDGELVRRGHAEHLRRCGTRDAGERSIAFACAHGLKQRKVAPCDK